MRIQPRPANPPPRIAFLVAAGFALLLALLQAPAAQAEERILNYAIEVDVRADGTLEVAEHIHVRAEGNQIRRGLYRDFPTRYVDRGGNRVVVGFEAIGVERDGRPEPWFTEHIANGVRINTGNDDFLPRLPGEYRYTLRYRTTRQLGFFPTHDELYWNAIGTGWVFPILAGDVTVRLPQAVSTDALRLDAYTGPQGAQGRDARAELPAPGVVRWTLTRPLGPYEGLTIALGFPKGLVPEPSDAQRLWWLLQDNRGVLIALAGLATLLTYCTRRWRRVGRDPRAGTIIARYEPPAGRSPAELRYLCRGGRYDTRCLTADLLTGAVAGLVALEREDRLLRRDLWRISRLRENGPKEGYATARSLLRDLLPEIGAELAFEQKNAPRLQRAQRNHIANLRARLDGSHFNRNAKDVGVAIFITFATGMLSLVLSGGGGIPLILAVCAAMAVCSIVFARLIKAPTVAGRKLIDEAEGLKLYLRVAERDELRRLGGPGDPPVLDAARYEALLPFAIALDVEEAWTRHFTAAAGAAAVASATGLAWYRGQGDIGSIAQSLGSSLSSSIASASSPPGSSSGGGGGGSSGGGGGGGGGGGR